MQTPEAIRHLRKALVLVLSVLIMGTAGYMLIEQLSFADALYTTVVMMATVGNVVRPLSEPGRLATDNDAHNISITLSARHLNSKLFIVARANHTETEVKLKLAGATRVVSPYTIGGQRMADVALEHGIDRGCCDPSSRPGALAHP